MSAWFDAKYQIPIRDVAGTSKEELHRIVGKKDDELPPLFFSFLPIALPVILISLVSILEFLMKTTEEGSIFKSDGYLSFFEYLSFFGNPNIAMSCAAGISIWLLGKQLAREHRVSGENLSQKLSSALEGPLGTAGVIILITGAGGAFGGFNKSLLV